MPGEPGRIVIEGTVAVREGSNVPADAAVLGKAVADQPPVALERTTIHLSPSADASARQAVTVSYRVRVPRNTRVIAVTGSGATTVSGIGADVSVRAGSAAITVGEVSGDATVVSGSGAVRISGATLKGTQVTGEATGTIGAGGPEVRLESRTGSITIAVAVSG